ncbi:response regulator [Desulfosporosinus nitroreducens]|uniref:Stage 0 sporulation protein A homolog n=1 Tax=Desulfosporosinus nitroreducens TaxID=2018668 RepID=A0ABT8QWF2_9FIRM|nr:response regulator transcription factor [Desulfosporosinus nitroreducens]MCO1600938.1 response regulator transcription factor [Desulfosporosinus nitroreducens]MDO0825671.1 response regulator transcription factor [Desulfosporosinus nitroreducens]
MNIIIVDDHPLVLHGLTAVIAGQGDMNLIGEAQAGNEAVSLITKSNPDVVLLDLRLKDMSGLEIIRRCREKDSACKYIIFTASVDREDFRRARELGVDGYILKEAFPEEVISAIRLVYRGRKYYDPSIIDSMMSKIENVGNLEDKLTSRELEVLTALGEGLNNKEIAKKLYISEYTVKKHVSQVLAKLKFADRTQAALYAQERIITA